MLERDNEFRSNNNNSKDINSYNNNNSRRIELKEESQRELASFGAVDKTQFTILDRIINDYGYGWEVNKIIFSAFLCFILNGYLTTSYCSFMLGFKKKI